MTSEVMYQEIFNFISDVVVLVDTENGLIREANRAAEEMYGYSREELLQLKNTDLSNEPEKTAADMVNQQARIPLRYHRKKDGTVFPVEINARHFDFHGTTVHLCVIRDITHRISAQQDLLRSIERFRLIFDNSDDSIFTADLQGKIVDVNQQACVKYGYNHFQFVGMSISDINDPDNAPLVSKRLKRTISEGSNRFETVHRTADGHCFPVDVAARIVTIGEERFILASCRDITERKQIENERIKQRADAARLKNWERLSAISAAHVEVEKKLVHSQRRLFMAMNIARLGSWEYDNTDRQITISDEFLDIYGTSASALGGCTMPVDRFMKLFVHPEDRERILEGLKQELSSEILRYSIKFEHRILYADGSEGFASVWLQVQKNIDDKVLHVYGLTQDMTENRKIQKELEISRDRFSQVAEQSGELIWEVDPNGLYTYVSPNCKDLLGYDDGDIVGKLHFYDLFPDSLRRELQHQASIVFEKKLPFKDFCNQVITSDGRVITVITNGAPFFDTDGTLIGYRGSDRDITEQQRLEQRLTQAARMESIGMLAGGIAHDFNNKLSVIMGYSEVARTELPDTANLDGYLQEITRAARFSADITSQLLAFSRQQITNPRILAVNTIIEDAMPSLTRLIGCDINLEFSSDDTLWSVYCDPVQIEQIIMNLTVNARDAMPRGGSLSIETANCTVDESTPPAAEARPGEYIRITVRDSGSGMDEDTVAHIFDPFFTTKEVGKGTGLGLATVYGIVTQNDGFITVDSTPGCGTAFRIYLPRHEAEIPDSNGPNDTPAHKTATLLLVEDDNAVREVTALLLKSTGYTVIQSESPYKALELFKQPDFQIDLIISDVLMPGMNGREMVDRIRTIDENVKVLFITGYDFDILSEKGINTTGIDLIQKPINMHELNIMIQKLLS